MVRDAPSVSLDPAQGHLRHEKEPAYVSLKGAMLLENSLLVLVLIGVVLTVGALTAEIKSPDLDLNIQLNVVLNLAVS
jgi:hypothetical protein